jgi:hypothetical protein
MHKIPQATYPDLQNILQRVETLRAEAARMQPGKARQSILVEASKLQAYADVKLWVSLPAKSARRA